ncbi:alpha-hydroxy acid oxidase [Actinocorallia aurea]
MVEAITFHDAQSTFVTLGEIHAAAQRTLDASVWDFLEGGAGAEWTLAANRAAVDTWAFRPRVLRGTSPPDLSTTLLGVELAMPVLVAPFGADRLFHPEGHRAVTAAVQEAGIASIVPEAGSFSLEALAKEAPGAARFFQLHALGSDEMFLGLAGRARDAGYEALCVTVDSPVDGWRERNKTNRFGLDTSAMEGNHASATELFGPMLRNDAPVWTWERLAGLARRAGMPFLAKGVLVGEDAALAVEAGACAVYVSNHGGRQLDGAPATLTQLPEIVQAVAGRVPVIIDGGFRRGTDILKALALGADAVALGRPVAYGLAAGGREGVAAVLDLLRREMRATMTLLGRATVADLGPDAVQRAER